VAKVPPYFFSLFVVNGRMTNEERMSILTDRIAHFDFIEIRAVATVLELMDLKGIIDFDALVKNGKH
jgi:hypothetical protein